MRPPRPLPESLRSRPFTVAQARALGVTTDELRRSALRAPHRGVRVPAGLPETVEVRSRAALLVLPEGTALSGATAVHLAGLPQPLEASPSSPSGPVVVTVRTCSTRPRVEGIDAHHGELGVRVMQHRTTGLPMIHPRHLWIDLAGELPFVDAVALADAVRFRWASAEAMSGALEAHSGSRDVAIAREVLASVRYRVESPMETRARLLFIGAGLPEPECGRNTGDGAGWIARLDLRWLAVKVAGEFDGDHHRTDRRQWAKDIARRRALEAAGWIIVTFTSDDLLRHPDRLVAEVAAALWRRGLRW